MKIAYFAALSLILSSCAHEIKRQAHILPVFEGSLLYNAYPKFISSDEPLSVLTPELKHQPKSSFSRMSDGSFLVTWISTLERREKLIFEGPGLHPVEVPNKAISETTNLSEEIPDGDPFVFTGFGPNTAYIRDVLDLRPIPTGEHDRAGNPDPLRDDDEPSLLYKESSEFCA